jgi:hypothetical protein
MDIAGLVPSDCNVGGVVEMMLDASQNYEVELNEERLYGWHTVLFPIGRSGMYRIVISAWRNIAGYQSIDGSWDTEKRRRWR